VSKQLVRNPLLWFGAAAAAAVALLVTFAYLGAFLDPVGNANHVPVAILSEDAGVSLGGSQVSLGGRLASAAAGGAIADPAARFTVLPSRQAVLSQMRDDSVFAAIVVPRDFTARVVGLASGASTAKAGLQILTNPGAGTIGASAGEDVARRTAEQFVKTATATLAVALRANGGPSAAALARGISVSTQVAVPIPQKSALGVGPFFFELTIALGGFFLAAILSFSIEAAAGRQKLELFGHVTRGKLGNLSRRAATRWKVGLTVVLSALTAVLQTVLAVEILGMHATNPVALALFSALGSAAVGMLTLFCLLAFDVAGRIVAALVLLLFGVPTSGGPYPQQALSRFFRFLGDFLPLRRMTDGARSLVFFDGHMGAGLATALWVLGAYLVGATLLVLLASAQMERRVRAQNA